MKFHHSIEWWDELCSKATPKMVEIQASKTTSYVVTMNMPPVYFTGGF